MKTSFRRLTLIVSIWVVLSALLFAYAHYYLVVTFPDLSDVDTYKPLGNLTGIIGATIIGGLVFGYFVFDRSYAENRRRSFRYGILNAALWFLITFNVANVLVTVPLVLVNQPGAGLTDVVQVVLGVLTNPATVVSVIVWGLIVAGTQFVLQVSDKFGPGVLWKLITGRYYAPREEERIFMFVDLKGSTTIAERVGHSRFFEFVREFIADATEPIIDRGGEINAYVGDEIITSWPKADRRLNRRPVDCFFAIEDAVEANSERYLDEYGFVPEFKAGLHVGRVTVGEIGVVRKDIAYSGDVMNTAARIQGACNSLGCRLLLSAELADEIEIEPPYICEKKGSVQLRGKEAAVPLVSISRKSM